MLLSRNKLDEVRLFKYAIIISGPLEDKDKTTLFKTHRNYNRERTFVGQSHIELFCCHDISSSLRDELKLTSQTTMIMLKNGIIVYTHDGSPLFKDTNSLNREIQDNFEINL